MKKRVLPILTAMLMAFVMIPVAGITTFADDDGLTLNDGVYEISSYTELKAFASIVNGGQTGANAKLTAEIKCTDSDWVPIGIQGKSYTGRFDGAGNKISNLNNESSNNGSGYQGLFGYIGSGGIVKNVNLEGGEIKGSRYVGSVAGYNDGGTITNCSTTVRVSGINSEMPGYIGGVVGCNEGGTITNCINTGAVSGVGNYVGGVVGRNERKSAGRATVTDCYNSGAVSGTRSYVGGVAGFSNSTITNCCNTSAVYGEVNDVGGVAGNNEGGTITSCCNTGPVKSIDSNAGGVAGNSSGGEINDCCNTGAVSAGVRAGGVVGFCNSTIKNCYNSGAVSGDNRIGGVAGDSTGYSNKEIKNCYNIGSVSGQENVGGVVGFCNSTIKNCYNSGAVSGDNRIGGVAGSSASGTITNCCYDRAFCTVAKAIGSGDDTDTVKGLYTSQMTGSNALENMMFSYAAGETNPWLMKPDGYDDESGAYYWYYPHLKGFNFNNDGSQTSALEIAPADWPAKVMVKAEWAVSDSYKYNGTEQGPTVRKIIVSKGPLDAPDGMTVRYSRKNDYGWGDTSETEPDSPGIYKMTIKDGSDTISEELFTILEQGAGKDYTVSHKVRIGADGVSGAPIWSSDDTAPVNAGSYKAVITFTASGHAKIEKGFEIKRVPLTITATDQIYEYNGQEQGEGEGGQTYTDPAVIAEKVTADGLRNNDAITSITLTGHRKEINEYPGEIQITGFTINNDIAAKDSYEVTLVPGKLTIKSHDMTKTDEVPATCTENGTKAYWTCSECHKLFSDEKGEHEITAPEVIKAPGHSMVGTDEVPATCTENGTKAYWTCSECHKLFSDEKGEHEITAPEIIKATGHDWGEWIVSKKATETEEGEEQRVCNNDPEHKETRVIPVIGHEHKLTETPAKAASCTEDGNNAYWTCDKGDNPCGRYFSDAEGTKEIEKGSWVIRASGHDWGEWTETKEPSCTEKGTREKACKDCGYKITEEIAATGHSMAKTDEVAATCTENGTKAYWTCSDCHKLFSDEKGEHEITEPEAIKATGHDWGEWKVTKDPEAGKAGEKQRVCKNDPSHIEKEAIPAPGPEPAPEPEPAPASKKTVSGTLLAKLTSKGVRSLELTWSRIDGADGYDIFLGRCGYKPPKKVKTIKGNETFKWTKKGLKKHRAYKAYVRAWVMKGGRKVYVRSSLKMHAYTSGGTVHFTNAKSVTVSKNKVSLEAGETYKIEARVNGLQSGKKLMPSGHAPMLRYVSSDRKIATVSKSGKITAKAKGSCRIYAIAVNGARKTIRLTIR